MTEELKRLVEAARVHRMSAEERDVQFRNFVVGNVGIENPRVTHAVVDEAMKRLEPTTM